MSLSRIAKILGVSRAAVSQYINGKRGKELPSWMREIIERHIDCPDIMKIIYEISQDLRFERGWGCDKG